jgi:hypothetical protein
LWSYFGIYFNINSVDGKSLGLYKNVSVSPGEHYISIGIGRFAYWHRKAVITLLAEPGHVYIVKVKPKTGFWVWYIVDSQTKEIVVGPTSF